MNTLFKQQFTPICDILAQCHLINTSDYNEERKEQAYLLCVPIFQIIQSSSLDNNVFTYVTQILGTPRSIITESVNVRIRSCTMT